MWLFILQDVLTVSIDVENVYSNSLDTMEEPDQLNKSLVCILRSVSVLNCAFTTLLTQLT